MRVALALALFLAADGQFWFLGSTGMQKTTSINLLCGTSLVVGGGTHSVTNHSEIVQCQPIGGVCVDTVGLDHHVDMTSAEYTGDSYSLLDTFATLHGAPTMQAVVYVRRCADSRFADQTRRNIKLLAGLLPGVPFILLTTRNIGGCGCSNSTEWKGELEKLGIPVVGVVCDETSEGLRRIFASYAQSLPPLRVAVPDNFREIILSKDANHIISQFRSAHCDAMRALLQQLQQQAASLPSCSQEACLLRCATNSVVDCSELQCRDLPCSTDVRVIFRVRIGCGRKHCWIGQNPDCEANRRQNLTVCQQQCNATYIACEEARQKALAQIQTTLDQTSERAGKCPILP
eukprot:TRINITY_DN3289_c0_g4_i1.p1 TRINITY_DN3289_c0_g4~~TRINITY_DN3289_c0_g4_i1.p1  ORF type:complete len:346 (-),score=52.89 TRINITY_DN3289_c0_g4_i1:36-1073(-)